MNKPIESLVIVGGGTAGWMAAAYLAKKFKGTSLRITLVESADIGTIGVGEATVPSIKLFLSELGIDEKEFIQATNATFKLGIEFEGWLTEGSRFFLPLVPLANALRPSTFITTGLTHASRALMNVWTVLVFPPRWPVRESSRYRARPPRVPIWRILITPIILMPDCLRVT